MVEFGSKTEGNAIVRHFSDQVRGRTFLITGPSPGGMGAETVISLARASPAMIILVGRSKQKCQPVIEEIEEIDSSIRVKFFVADLASLESVQNAAQAILDDDSILKIDVMINNAAIMMCPYQKTVNGFELQFASCHLGHFVLTNRLMPKILAESSAKRVVNVSSSGNKLSDIRWTDPGFEEPGSYSPVEAYGQAKTANILFPSASISDWDKWAYMHTLWAVLTNLGIYLTPEIRAEAIEKTFGNINPVNIQRKTLQQGCSTALRAALDPDLPKEDGVFLEDCCLTTPSESLFLATYAVDANSAEHLWKMSEEMISQKFSY
ncbi:hypothetical protein TrVFT333_004572 [Trichoderma virens FT-333]|nr:hypothetical protein TrVFT333_004572 [Trichoderma virens FT-333]